MLNSDKQNNDGTDGPINLPLEDEDDDNDQDFIILEQLDQGREQEFKKKYAYPYFIELFKDLSSRDSQAKDNISKVVFQDVILLKAAYLYF